MLYVLKRFRRMRREVDIKDNFYTFCYIFTSCFVFSKGKKIILS